MKRAEKILLICLLTTFIAGTAAGCGSMKSDVISYVDATIDLFVKGKTEEYMNITKSTEEEALKIYNDFIDIWANLFIVHEISEESREAFRELFREVFAEAKYKVKSTEKVEGEHKYIVIIEVEQITGLFEGLKKEVGMKLSDWEYAQPERPDDEEYNKAGYEILYECLKSRQKEITYCEPEEIKIEVVQIDGKYGIVSEGYQAIRDSLISMGELMETE